LHDGDVVRSQRHVNRKDTASAEHIPDVDITAVGPYGLPRDREAEAETGPIGSAYELFDRNRLIARQRSR
jgi:hypothetical protein